VQDGERKPHLIQEAVQPFVVVIDADKHERHRGIVLVFRVRRFQVRQLRTADPSPGGEEIQQQHLAA
jgi:hypothetical protein